MKSEKIVKDEKSNILIAIVRSVTGVDPEMKTRDKEVIMARKIFYKVMRDVEKISFFRMGSVFGQDHATVRHAVRDMETLLTYDKDLIKKYANTVSAFNTAIRSKNRIEADPEKGIELGGHIYEKLMDMNDQMMKQNLYIAEIKAEMAELNQKISSVKDSNKGLESIFEMIVDRVPSSKVNDAKRKIRTVLNGL